MEQCFRGQIQYLTVNHRMCFRLTPLSFHVTKLSEFISGLNIRWAYLLDTLKCVLVLSKTIHLILNFLMKEGRTSFRFTEIFPYDMFLSNNLSFSFLQSYTKYYPLKKGAEKDRTLAQAQKMAIMVAENEDLKTQIKSLRDKFEILAEEIETARVKNEIRALHAK